MEVVSRYTRESGVRQLERQVGAVARKVARRVAAGEEVERTITPKTVRDLLGRPRVHPEHAASANEVGVATGMYYTPSGGDIMFVEAAIRKLHGSSSHVGRDGPVRRLGQRLLDPDRPAWRRHERVSPGGDDLRGDPCP